MNCSFSFFFFGFHVHEKTILLPIIPAILLINENPFFRFSIPYLIVISTFSLYPLLVKDELQLPYFILIFIFIYFSINYTKILENKLIFYSILFSSICMMIIHIMISLIKPPVTLPYLFTYFNNLFSFLHFFLFWISTNLFQILSP
jgi:alpha-1,3-glucosyltransferase